MNVMRKAIHERRNLVVAERVAGGGDLWHGWWKMVKLEDVCRIN